MQEKIHTDAINDKISYRNAILKIVAFIIVLIASFSFIFTINEKGYTEINHVIEQYPQQDTALNHLNVLRNKVSKLINLQQLNVYLDNSSESDELHKDNLEIDEQVNILKKLMLDDPQRAAGIREIDSLLKSRNRLFESYLELQLQNKNNEDLKGKAKEIEQILSSKIFSRDTSNRIVLRYEHTQNPHIIEPFKSKPIVKKIKTPAPQIEKKRRFHLLPSFLRRKNKKEETEEEEIARANRKFHFLPAFLRRKNIDGEKEQEIVKESDKNDEFKPTKNQEELILNTPRIVTEHRQDIDIVIDSTEIEKRDSALSHLQTSLLALQTKRNKNSIEIKTQEILLLNTNDLIISQILSIIKQLEDRQIAIKNNQNIISQNLAFKSIQVNKVILWIIALLSVLLSLWIMIDFFKMMRIRSKLDNARREAEFHSQAKQMFLANMSHEIRTPLQSIIGYTEILSEKDDSHELETIRNSSRHLLHVVNEILDYDKIIAGKYTFQENIFHPKEIIDEVWEICLLNPNAKRLELIDNYQFDNNHLIGDSFRLKQIVLNLFNNSLKYTESGSVVLEGETIQKGETIELHLIITDTGIGIPEDKLSSIFNKYEQSSEEHHLTGSGLGLSIVKELIEGQNGTLDIRSTVGQGTSIHVMIPYKESKSHQLGEKQPKKSITNDYFIDAKIYFIEDDPIIQQLLISFTKGYIREVKIFNNAEEFYAQADYSMDCIVSDIRLSGKIDGIQFIRSLRKKRMTLPCIAVTAQALKEEHEAILDAGFNEILVKPFSKESLREIILKNNSIHAQRLMTSQIQFSNITGMTSDRQIIKNIMDDFYEQTLREIQIIRLSKPEELTELVLTLVHRIAGRLLQIGSTGLGEKWRKLEYQIRDQLIVSIQDAIFQNYLIELETEIKQWKNREELEQND